MLAPGGTLLFNVWDRIKDNEFAAVVTDALQARFPHDPPRFMARTPHGYFDRDLVAGDLQQAGFMKRAQIDTLAARSRATSARIPAYAYCEGTPLRGEIEARDAGGLATATDACEQALAARFGRGALDGRIQALVVAVSG